MVRPLLKVKGKILVIRHSICRCVHAVMRLLKWLITLFVPYERNWFAAIRILLRLVHTETGLDCNCTLSDRGVRENPRGSRKMPNFSDDLTLPYCNIHTGLNCHFTVLRSRLITLRAVRGDTVWVRSLYRPVCLCVCVN